jgi:predicted PurR-regulated permease PerM
VSSAVANGPFTRPRLATAALLVVTTLLVILTYKVTEPFIPALSWGVALAIVGYPIHAWISRRLRKPNWAAGASVAVIMLVLVLPVVFVTQQTVREAQQLIEQARSAETRERWERFKREYPRAGRAAEWVRQQAAGKQIVAAGQRGDQLMGALSGTVVAIVQLLVALFALFFFFRDRAPVLKFLRSMMPLTKEETDRLFKTAYDTVYATVFGHVGVALIQGALGGLMFWFLGLPAPLLWGVVMGLLAIIPVLGAFVIWVPAAVYLALSGELWKAGALVAWGTIVVGTIDNVLYPIFVGKRLRLHTLPVFIAIVGGLSVFGTAGVVLGPLVLALLMAIIEVWKQRTRAGQSAEEELEAA